MRIGDIRVMPLNVSISGVVPYTIIHFAWWCDRPVMGIYGIQGPTNNLSVETVPFVILELTQGTERCNPVESETIRLPFTAH